MEHMEAKRTVLGYVTEEDGEEETGMEAWRDHLPPLVALEMAGTYLEAEWGPAALRETIVGEIGRCVLTGECARAMAAIEALEHASKISPAVDLGRRGHRRVILEDLPGDDDMPAS